jgi:hypothetical protein
MDRAAEAELDVPLGQLVEDVTGVLLIRVRIPPIVHPSLLDEAVWHPRQDSDVVT